MIAPTRPKCSVDCDLDSPADRRAVVAVTAEAIEFADGRPQDASETICARWEHVAGSSFVSVTGAARERSAAQPHPQPLGGRRSTVPS